MIPVVTTFVVSLTIVLGAYWAFIVRPEMNVSRKLQRRLRPDAPVPVAGPTLARRPPPLSAVKGLDAVLGRSGRLLEPLRRTLEDSGLTVTLGIVFLGSVIAAMVALAIVLTLTSMMWLALVAAVAASAVPYLLVKRAATKRVQQFEELFPQAIDLIASALRAGHTLTTGVSMVSDEVADPMGAEFRLLYDHQNYGMPLPDALKAFVKRVPLLDARFFVTAVLTQREAGGNLAEVLDNLSTLIRERSRIKRQVRVASAHGRITGWVLSVMPPALALIMTLVAPAHMRSFINDPLGVRMIIFALVLQVIGTVAIRRIVDVEF